MPLRGLCNEGYGNTCIILRVRTSLPPNLAWHDQIPREALWRVTGFPEPTLVQI